MEDKTITVYNDTKTTAEKALSICKECDYFNECLVEEEIKEGHIECAALMDVLNGDIESVNQNEGVR